MDTVSEYAEQVLGFGAVTQFGIAGASKRGWTTWTTSAVDERVIACMPVVMDDLNFNKNIHHHFRAYGGWSFALTDYYDLNFTQQVDNPNTQLLMDIVDPYQYMDKLPMPKLVINAGMDEFFLPDGGWLVAALAARTASLLLAPRARSRSPVLCPLPPVLPPTLCQTATTGGTT